jgi:hypothetical protein
MSSNFYLDAQCIGGSYSTFEASVKAIKEALADDKKFYMSTFKECKLQKYQLAEVATVDGTVLTIDLKDNNVTTPSGDQKESFSTIIGLKYALHKALLDYQYKNDLSALKNKYKRLE